MSLRGLRSDTGRHDSSSRGAPAGCGPGRGGKRPGRGRSRRTARGPRRAGKRRGPARGPRGGGRRGAPWACERAGGTGGGAEAVRGRRGGGRGRGPGGPGGRYPGIPRPRPPQRLPLPPAVTYCRNASPRPPLPSASLHRHPLAGTGFSIMYVIYYVSFLFFSILKFLFYSILFSAARYASCSQLGVAGAFTFTHICETHAHFLLFPHGLAH